MKLSANNIRMLRILEPPGDEFGRGHLIPTHYPTCPPRDLCEMGLAVETEQRGDSSWFRITPAGRAALERSDD